MIFSAFMLNKGFSFYHKYITEAKMSRGRGRGNVWSDIDQDYGDDSDFQMLSNLHTGHYWFGLKSTEISRANSPSPSDDDDENRPNPLSFMELGRNLVVVDDFGQVHPYHPASLGRATVSSSATTHQTAKSYNVIQKQEVETSATTIAKKLTALITKSYCHLCKFNTFHYSKHYHNAGHYIKVREWIEGELTKVKEPVDQILIFCQACNLPLSGDETACMHYLTQNHTEKAKSFCTSCQRMIDAADMASHKQSKQHLKKIENLRNGSAKPTLEVKGEAPKNVPTKETIVEVMPDSEESPINPVFNPMEVPIENETLDEQSVPSGLNVGNKDNAKAFSKETEETSELTSSELQRLVMLEQLDLLRIVKEKELIILNRLRAETIQKV